MRPPPRAGVLLITPEPIGDRMAGPAIRALELSRALARDGRSGPITVASLAGVARTDAEVGLVEAGTASSLSPLVARAAAVLVQGDVLGLHPWLAQEDVPLVVDAYDPYHLEQLEQARHLGERARRAVVRDCVRSLGVQLSRADLVLCASARQRDLWTGHLAALGRINPVTYDQSHDLSRLLAVVPFGVSTVTPPRRDRSVLRAAFPTVGDDDVVLIWGGGIYDWFDPQLLVRAVAAASPRVPGLKLVFLGTQHPVGVASTAVGAAVAAAEDSGLLGSSILFHDGWVPYDERGRWLRAADIGVSTHLDHVETRFAFRTRLLDYLWAGLPVVTTGGDDLGAEMALRGVARIVRPGLLADLTEAVVAAATDEQWRRTAAAGASRMAGELSWDRVVIPLADFCGAPTRAPDLVLDQVDRRQLGLAAGTVSAWSTVPGRLRAARREGGLRLIGRRVGARMRGLLSGPRIH